MTDATAKDLEQDRAIALLRGQVSKLTNDLESAKSALANAVFTIRVLQHEVEDRPKSFWQRLFG